MKRLFSFILSLVLCTVALANATNCKVVKAASTDVEQVTHYYPYGGVIGDISTQESTQKYKFEGKELDRSFGLDNYDIHARNYFAMLPMWDRVDPLAEKYYGISPYVYCGGDPVNKGDYDGCWVQCAVGAVIGGVIEAKSAIDSEEPMTDVIIAAGKGAINGAIAASGAGVVMSAVAGGLVEMTSQVVSVFRGKDFKMEAIGDAVLNNATGSILGKGVSSMLKKSVNNVFNNKSIVQLSKKIEKKIMQYSGEPVPVSEWSECKFSSAVGKNVTVK